MASGGPTGGYPVGAIVTTAYRETFADHPAVLRAAGLWMLASLVVDLLAVLGSAGEPPAVEPVPTPFRALALPLLLIGWVGLNAVTVHRLRHLLLGDPTPRLMAPLDRHVARYILAELLIGALALLPALVALALLAPVAGAPLAAMAGTAAAAAVFARLHLGLVGAALGEQGLGLDRAWRATAAIWPQVAVALLACSAPLALLTGMLGGWLVERGAPLTGSALGTLGAFGQAAVLAAFLAASRRRLIGPALGTLAGSS